MPTKRGSHKRTLSSANTAATDPVKKTRQSPRAAKDAVSSKLVKAKAKASATSTEDEENDDTASDFDDDSPMEEDSAEEDVESDFSEEEPTSKRKSTGSRGISNHSSTGPFATSGRSQDIRRSGVKTGLGPGTQVVMKKPKARQAGDVSYTEDTVHPNTMLFLGDLAANNNRAWLKSKLD
jgi:hypothetical protein